MQFSPAVQPTRSLCPIGPARDCGPLPEGHLRQPSDHLQQNPVAWLRESTKVAKAWLALQSVSAALWTENRRMHWMAVARPNDLGLA